MQIPILPSSGFLLCLFSGLSKPISVQEELVVEQGQQETYKQQCHFVIFLFSLSSGVLSADMYVEDQDRENRVDQL